MAVWTISYTYEDNTSTLALSLDAPPSPEEAALHLLTWARRNLPHKTLSEAQDHGTHEPAERLLREHGITITGITRA